MVNYVVGHGMAAHSCNCIGPQNGEPLCPCQMRGVTVEDGRYKRVTDLGPVKIGRSLFKPETREEEIERLKRRLKELGA